MSKKHYVVYFQNENTITKTSKEWAKDNQECFPNYAIKIPTSNEIDRYLVDNFGFTLTSDDEKFVCFKLTGNINFNLNNPYLEILNFLDNGYNDYEINFRIGQNNYFLGHTPNPNTVTLIINEMPSNPIRPQLDIISGDILNLGNDWVYDNNGIHKTTHSEARQLFLYLINNF